MKKVNKFAEAKNWNSWVKNKIVKRSGRPFKSGLKIGTAVELTTNPNTDKEAFLMDDGSIVDCSQCKLSV